MDITELSGPARTAYENFEFHRAKWLRAHQALSSAQAAADAANRAMDVVTYEAVELGVPVGVLAHWLREDERSTRDRVQRVHVERTIGYRAVRMFGPGAQPVHVVTAIARFSGMVALGCTGRAMDGMVGTDQAVTCKACIRRHERLAREKRAAGDVAGAAVVLGVLGGYRPE